MRVVSPCHHNVVRTHPVRDIVASEGSCVGDPLRHAAFSRHHINLRVAVVLPREREALSVRREPGEHRVSHPAGEPPCYPTGRGNSIEITRIREDHLVAMNCREPQKPHILLTHEERGAAKEQTEQKNKTETHHRKSFLWVRRDRTDEVPQSSFYENHPWVLRRSG